MSSTIFSAKCFLCLRVANLHDFWWWTVGEFNLKCMHYDYFLKFFLIKVDCDLFFFIFALFSK